MAEPKTQLTQASVADFIAKLADPQLQADCQTLCQMMEKVSGSPPKMWGASIVGFGTYRYTYASGRTGDWMEIGFSPRKQNLTIYLMCGVEEADGQSEQLLSQLGTHSCGKSCLYIKRLADLNQKVLLKLIQHSVATIRNKYPAGAAESSKTTATTKTTASSTTKKITASKAAPAKQPVAKQPVAKATAKRAVAKKVTSSKAVTKKKSATAKSAKSAKSAKKK
jgi:hypothetical protein